MVTEHLSIRRAQLLLRRLALESYAVLVFTAALLGGSGDTLLKLLSLVPALLFGWLVFLVNLLFKTRFSSRNAPLYISILFLTASYVFGLLRDASGQALENVVQLLLVLGFFLGVSSMRWDASAISIWGRPSLVFLASLFAFWMVEGMPRLFSGPMGNPNGLGLFSYLISYFPVAMLLGSTNRYDKFIGLIGVCFSIALILASDARASLIAFSATFLMYKVITSCARNKWICQALFSLVLVGVLLAPLLYSSAPEYDWARKLNDLSIEYTGKNFFSGRQVLWPILIRTVEQNIGLGYGPGAQARQFTNLEFSSHNLYLQIALQVGLLGLISFLVLLWSAWSLFLRNILDIYTRLSAAFLLGIIFHQTFEVSLIQNNLAPGFLAWLILGVGVSRASSGGRR